jgi:hypothetical protein
LQTVAGTGFSIGVPSGWKQQTLKDSVVAFAYANPAIQANVNEITSSGRSGRTMSQWAADLKKELVSAVGVTPSVSFVTLRAGKAVRLTVTQTVNGAKLSQVQYAVDAGATAYVFTFTASAAQFAADQPTFAKIIASLRLTS